MKNKKVLNMVYAAVFAAMIFALTRFVQIPVPGGAGYLHFGDAMIYIVASTLGGPWALLASAVGAALADLSSPYAIYAPVSIIVKVLIALPFVLVNKKERKDIDTTYNLPYNTKWYNYSRRIFCRRFDYQ